MVTYPFGRYFAYGANNAQMIDKYHRDSVERIRERRQREFDEALQLESLAIAAKWPDPTPYQNPDDKMI